MSTTVQNITINLVASFIWFLIGIGLTQLYFYFSQKSPLRRVWGIRRSDREFHVAVSSLSPQKASEYKRPTTGIGELQAISFVRESLISAYGSSTNIQLAFSNKFPDTFLANNIISVGGIKYNEITRLLLRSMNLPLDIITDANAYAFDTILNQRYNPVINGTTVEEDYGLIIKMPNLYNHERTVLILRGTHTFGTAGAGRMLTKPYVIRLAKEIRKSKAKYWQALVFTRVRGLQVFPELITLRPLDPGIFFYREGVEK